MRFVEKLKFTNRMWVRTGNETVTQPFILITYTTGFGEVPSEVSAFLERHHHLMEGVVASGNRNWGDNFAKAGRLISYQYEKPLIHEFELAGLQQDIIIVEKGVDQIGLFREE